MLLVTINYRAARRPSLILFSLLYMRALIIEDDQEANTFLQINLQTDFTVDSAFDGEIGAQLACENVYDLIVLDNALPKKDGPEVCCEIREAEKNVPILVVSIKNDPQEKTMLLDLGADDYMTKPFVLSELRSRIRALLRRTQTTPESILSIDNVTLDTRRHIVLRNEKTIPLTRKEFMLLRYLLTHKDEVLSRDLLLENVWGAEAKPLSSTVEAHISTLRKKIDTKKEKKLIHTISGSGYVLSTHQY